MNKILSKSNQTICWVLNGRRMFNSKKIYMVVLKNIIWLVKSLILVLWEREGSMTCKSVSTQKSFHFPSCKVDNALYMRLQLALLSNVPPSFCICIWNLLTESRYVHQQEYCAYYMSEEESNHDCRSTLIESRTSSSRHPEQCPELCSWLHC